MTSSTDDGSSKDRASDGDPPEAGPPRAGHSDRSSASSEHELPGWMRTDRAELEGANLATLGLGFAASVALLTVGGLYLDRHLGTKPLFLLLGLVAGLVGGTVSLVRKAGAISRR